MKSNSLENLIADQIFKIQPADENISNYLSDCYSPFNRMEDVKEIPFGTIGGLESSLNKKAALGERLIYKS